MTDPAESSQSALTPALTAVLSAVARRNRLRNADPLPTLAELSMMEGLAEHYREEGVLPRPDASANRRALGEALALLCEAGELHCFEIAPPDPLMHAPARIVYAVSDPQLCQDLLGFLEEQLLVAYELQFHRRRPLADVEADLTANLAKYRQGQPARLLLAVQALREILTGNALATGTPVSPGDSVDDSPWAQSGSSAADPAAAERRAVDTTRGQAALRIDLIRDWQEAAPFYGVQFLLRVYLRRNEFERIQYLVNTRSIASAEDLRYIREIAQRLANRLPGDPELHQHGSALRKLLSAVEVKLQLSQLGESD